MLSQRALLLAAISLWTGCQAIDSRSATKHQAEIDALRAVEIAEEQAWIAKDLEKAVSFYADDAVFMNNNSPLIRGKDHIRAAMKPEFDDANARIGYEITAVDVAGSGELGYTAGTWFVTSVEPRTQKSTISRGKWVTVRKRQPDGQWKIVYDIGNSDPPTAPSAKQ